ncbi:MAG: HAD family hydrolase [Halorientalis sp.]
MPALAAVVFDLDDTLAVTDRPRQALLDAATARVGAASIDRADYLDVHGSANATETRAPIFERLGDADPTALATAYRAAVGDALEPVPGAADLVRALRETYRVGLLTDGPSVAQRDKLERLGWSDLFDAVVVTGELAESKPHADAFGAICAELAVEPGATAFVGDRPDVDVAGAGAAGLHPVQVTYPDGPPRHPAAEATVERARLAADLPDVLAGL